MSVYVDQAEHQVGRMKMCHMLADTAAELREMAAKIGVAGRWIQHPGTAKEHFDICKSARTKALELGAIEVDSRGIVEVLRRKRGAA